MACFTRILLTIVAVGSTVCSVLPASAESSPIAQTESASSPLSATITSTPVASEVKTDSAKTIVASEELSRETVAAKPAVSSNPRIPLFSRIFPAPSMQQ